MKIQNNQFLSIEQLQAQYFKQTDRSNGNSKGRTEDGLSFLEVLHKTAEKPTIQSDVKFSKHAASRLLERNIELTESQFARLQQGTAKAGAKGINESLVIVDQLAFIVNIPNQTVVTAMNQTEANEKVFTNIDGAIIM